MMMPIVDQSPSHHHHGHGHQIYYHHEHIPEQAGKMQLTLILPNGVPSVISVDPNTPMMDLLVQAASSNKLNPSGYSLVVLDSNEHIIHFKPNQPVGQIVTNCQLPQLNGSSTISLLPKENLHLSSTPSSSKTKTKTQPFEITVRLQVNLPDGQKILLRVDPNLPLYEIKEQICKQKKYTNSHRYTLCLPSKLDRPLLLGLSLAECKTNELNLMYLRTDPRLSSNQIQSFDRLYRTRSESQPPRETVQEIQNEQQDLTNTQQRPASVQLNPSRASHPITSHTSLHAYWNDPNFDTQSQISNCSSTTKKRRAPRPPGYISPTINDQQIILSQISDHHQSQESLTESLNGTKQKRKAPIVPTTSPTTDDQQLKSPIESETIEHDEHQTTPNVELTQTPHSPEQDLPESHSTTPIYSQIQKVKESTPMESPYSAIKSTPTPPVPQQQEEQKLTISSSPPSTGNYSVEEIVQAGIAEPPPKATSPPPKATSPPPKATSPPPKKSSSVDGLIKIVNDHNERAKTFQANEKSTEDISYFRVAKSRNGRFETENQGFVNNTSTNLFEAQAKEKSPTPIQLEVTERTTHISVTVESDRKQLITRASPVPPNSPPAVAPKPTGKTITEYRTIKKIGQGGETTTTTTVRTEVVPSTLNNDDNNTTIEKKTDDSENLTKQ